VQSKPAHSDDIALLVRNSSCTVSKPLFDLPAWSSPSLSDANLLVQATFRSILY
jgi:hypothetical protein